MPKQGEKGIRKRILTVRGILSEREVSIIEDDG